MGLRWSRSVDGVLTPFTLWSRARKSCWHSFFSWWWASASVSCSNALKGTTRIAISLLCRVDAASRKAKLSPSAVGKTMIPSCHASPSTKASASFCSSLRSPVLGCLNRPMAAIKFSSVPKYRFGGAFCGLDSGLRRRHQSHLGQPRSREDHISSSLE